MKKANYFSITLAIFLSVVLSSCASTKADSLYASSKPLSVNYHRVYENYGYLESALYYPSIVSFETLNSKIKETIFNDWNSFNEYAKSHKKDGIFAYNLDSVVRNQGDLISVKLLVSKTLKGVEGSVKATTLCFNKETEKFLNISDICSYDAQKLSELCYKALEYNIIDQNIYYLNDEELQKLEEKIKEETAPVMDNFSCFTMEGEYICIYFNDIFDAEYAEDIPKAEIVFRN